MRRCGLLLLLVVAAAAGSREAPPAAGAWRGQAAPPPRGAPDVDELISRLGDADYGRREAATQDLISLGGAAVEAARARLLITDDPEIVHRLRYVLEHAAPPARAALVVRAAEGSGLSPGDVITHVGGRRVGAASEVRRLMASTGEPVRVHVASPRGPLHVGPVTLAQLEELSDYVAPRGAAIAEAVRLYGEGFVERADVRLRALGDDVPEAELSRLLRARIVYTAGSGAEALALLEGREDAVRSDALGGLWTGPSLMDLAGPGEAPFHLEHELFDRGGPSTFARAIDPDMRIQRVFVPARRYADAMRDAARLWWVHYRENLSAGGDNVAAGNMLAVAAWMLSELDLTSECCRLIRPRSAILTFTWVRVETDAWLEFLAGRERAALESFYDDARVVLQRHALQPNVAELTRNPIVAAAVAFFLYQTPDDPRIAELLGVMNDVANPALTAYLDWMLYAVDAHNADAVRRDVATLLPTVSDARVAPYARAVALLEYVREKPQAELFLAARERLAQLPLGAARDADLALVEALAQLAADRPAEARALLAQAGDEPGADVLRCTADFLAAPPPAAANHGLLRNPLLVVPVGREGSRWIVLARDRRLLLFDAPAGTLTPLPRPTPSWFPRPPTWPWLGREPDTGRVWAYDRRRVVELAPAGASALRLNLAARDVGAFDRHVRPFFSLLSDAVAAVPLEPGERGEFLTREVQAHAELASDPALPEIGLIQPVVQDARVLHVALRGGPHVLIDVPRRRAWSSVWIAERLGLDASLTFFPQASWPEGDASPRLWLASDQGLVRFEPETEALERVALPADPPHPALVPESTPYLRRDPRFIYVARLPEEGGAVFRLHVEAGRVERAEPVDMVNETLPAGYYAVRSRVWIRRRLDDALRAAGLPGLEGFVTDARETVERWQRQRAEPRP